MAEFKSGDYKLKVWPRQDGCEQKKGDGSESLRANVPIEIKGAFEHKVPLIGYTAVDRANVYIQLSSEYVDPSTLEKLLPATKTGGDGHFYKAMTFNEGGHTLYITVYCKKDAIVWGREALGGSLKYSLISAGGGARVFPRLVPSPLGGLEQIRGFIEGFLD